MKTQSLLIKRHHFILHPSATLFWQERATLLISDVHLGKVSHFRKFGAAVPRKAIHRNFELLDRALDAFKPKTLCFLGDLFHSALNQEWLLFEKWITDREAHVILVAGNHDIISPIKYESLGIQVVSEVQWDGFLLTHHPEERKGFFNFCGHIHPAIRLRGKGRQSLRLPCFFKSQNQMILPAFGEFTGTHILEPKAMDQVYPIVENEVLRI